MENKVPRNLICIASLVLAISLFAGASAVAAEPSPSSEAAAPTAVEPSPSGEGAAPITPFDETCNSGNVCVWTSNLFQGAKGESLCTGGAHVLAGDKFSAKNRCANKASFLRENGAPSNCLNPGQNGSNLFNFNEVFIGAEGSRC